MNTKKIRILPISDIHNTWSIFDYIVNNFTGKIDLITISGDIYEGRIDYPQNFIDMMECFQKEIDVPIVLIQGNHDWWDNKIFQDSKNIHVLHNQSIDIMGLKIYGTPDTPTFMNWNNMAPDREDGLGRIYDGIPTGIDVLLSHGPPYGYCDTCGDQSSHNPSNFHLGSHELLNSIKINKPKNVFCGHIHGQKRHECIVHSVLPFLTKTDVYGCSCLDENYSFGKLNPYPSVITIDIM